MFENREIYSYATLIYGTGQPLANIYCFDKGNKQVASCNFYVDGTPLTQNFIDDKGICVLNFLWSQYNAIVALLNNIKPLYIFYNPDTFVGYISTKPELVGKRDTDY